MKPFWQAKIWGLLHDPIYKALQTNAGRGEQSFWKSLDAMADWTDSNFDPEQSQKVLADRIQLADYIASASDRGAIGNLSATVNYNSEGLQISHLLSGRLQTLKINPHEDLLRDRATFLNRKSEAIRAAIPNDIANDPKALFWWLWRCLPIEACRQCDDETLMLMPAETRFPDASIWSHASMSAALAGAFMGYDRTSEFLHEKTYQADLSHAYLATFTFSPIQELIKASRKIRDFWAGSWVLHYLSARVSYKLAQLYGPDSLLYPSLYQQPLIDLWLRQDYPAFESWIPQPSDRALLTAGFPNVAIAVLPKARVSAAMQTARQTLLEAWMEIGDLVFQELQDNRHWMPGLQPDASSWKGWLKSQWQTYWSAVPIGSDEQPLKTAALDENAQPDLQQWIDAQNQIYRSRLLEEAELTFVRRAYRLRQETVGRKFSINVGSWWSKIFDSTRLSLNAVKNARSWEIPTAFGPRSSISGIGAAVHPGDDWATEGQTQKYWRREAGLFDGIEQLNATETVKRGLEKVLPKLLDLGRDRHIAPYYPDLTSGVAGYLNTHPEHCNYYRQACRGILEESGFAWVETAIADMKGKWGIPQIDDSDGDLKNFPPRLLNAGWLVEDAEDETITALQASIDREDDPAIAQTYRQEAIALRREYRQTLQAKIDEYYRGNNPADWYVLAAGDGDSMSEWLKGTKMRAYRDYVPDKIKTLSIADKDHFNEAFQAFLDVRKRMGPATHNALSRALLDFSNQLVPYLTERRYAGRLIYSGGDDVLAYTNLWEWDRWLWDIRQCFRGQADPEFDNAGHYWRWQGGEIPKDRQGRALLSSRPLFTLGECATISFGVVIAHHSVPLAIALSSLWEAEEEAKQHESPGADGKSKQKDAVQVRVLYGTGNTLAATSKFDTLRQWQNAIAMPGVEHPIFEQVSALWEQHPAPTRGAIAPWTQAFTQRRDAFEGDDAQRAAFQQRLQGFVETLWDATPLENFDRELKAWFKLAAFVLRNRTIRIGGEA